MADLSREQAERIRDLVKVSPVAADLAARFERAGHALYLVGGSVRDALLGRGAPDLDFATDAKPEQVLELVRGWAQGTWLTGIKFGTVGVQKGGRRLEITTFREERYRAGSRQPEVRLVPTIEADLSRRDFTVNAMAVRLPDREFVDPYGGLGDLVAKRLRTPLRPEESFADDPLRMLRAARFVATLELQPDPALVAAMKSERPRLRIVSAERIRDEVSKILDATRPSLGLGLATEAGLSDLIVPELPALRLEQDPIHRHKDVYRHTLAVVDRVAALDPGPQPDTVLRMAALLHDVGKPQTRRIDSEGVTFHHHEVVGAQIAEKRLRALRYPNDFIEPCVELVRMHLRFHTFRLGWSDAAVRRYVRDAGPLLDRLNRLVRADCTTRNRFRARRLEAAMDELEARIAALAEQENLKELRRPPIDGNDVMGHLGVPPGPVVGEALDYLSEQKIQRGEIGRDEALRLLDEWAAERGLR